jgi:hypothetical protein
MRPAGRYAGMTISRLLPLLLAGLLWAGADSSRAADGPAASAPSPARSSEATKARQEADRQRLIAKLRSDAPKVPEKQAKASPLDLPIFRRHDRP